MEWFKKHADTVVILAAVAGSVVWMNGRFNQFEKDLSDIEKEIAVIKTVMILKHIMPVEMAKNNKEDIVCGEF